MNTKMYYLYRDASNYKTTNVAIIEGEISKEQIAEIIGCLDEGEYFIPSAVGLDEERFGSWDDECDHYFFELNEDDFELTEESGTVGMTVEELVEAFKKMKGRWGERVTILEAETIDTLAHRDEMLEEAWRQLSDVPFDPDTEKIEESFMCFRAGTDREDIWKWFDARYSKGVAALLYGDGVDRTADLADLAYRKAICFECDAEHCAFNPEGVCTYPLVTGKKPDYLNENGCTAFVYVEQDALTAGEAPKGDEPLLAFVKEEVPFRIREILGVDEEEISEELIAEIAAHLFENSDILFDYDAIDNEITDIFDKRGIEWGA